MTNNEVMKQASEFSIPLLPEEGCPLSGRGGGRAGGPKMNSCAFIMALVPLFAALVLPSHAQTYPNRAVRIIVPLAAGGGMDTVAGWRRS